MLGARWTYGKDVESTIEESLVRQAKTRFENDSFVIVESTRPYLTVIPAFLHDLVTVTEVIGLVLAAREALMRGKGFSVNMRGSVWERGEGLSVTSLLLGMSKNPSRMNDEIRSGSNL